MRSRQVLIDAGAPVSQQDNFGRTALHFGAGLDHEGVVACLLAHGADANAVDDINGWTALHWASDKGYHGIGEILVEEGADLSIQDKFGHTALHYATEDGHAEMFATLTPKSEIGSSPRVTI